MHALFRVFSPMLSRGELQKPKKATAEDKKATVTLWLRDNYVKYLNRMCAILNLPEAGLQVPALKILLDLIKLESAHLSTLSGSHHFANDLYLNVVDALLNCNNMSAPLLDEFTQKYFGFFDDLRFYFLKNAAQIINAALGSKPKKDNKTPQSKVHFVKERKKIMETRDRKKKVGLSETTTKTPGEKEVASEKNDGQGDRALAVPRIHLDHCSCEKSRRC